MQNKFKKFTKVRKVCGKSGFKQRNSIKDILIDNIYLQNLNELIKYNYLFAILNGEGTLNSNLNIVGFSKFYIR